MKDEIKATLARVADLILVDVTSLDLYSYAN